ncbi:protein UXT homolog isoform X1 [Papaver somniferum]|uniref:protein UXT homolog isoform X1 n=1 Tax=Papaver somniferum TaxID=3469 RepID=UPI000E703A81|nr:protein UXT homolog isoform X1 [Papaver somniferum]
MLPIAGINSSNHRSSDLRKRVETLEKNAVTSLRTLVNLDSEVYTQADVLDTRHIFVDVGLGFHVEFTWPEALEFISLKEARLAKYVLLLLLYIYFDSLGLVLHGLSNKWK